MSQERGAPQRQSFWTTLPGILTGVAAVLTALGGMIAILDRGESRSEPQPSDVIAEPAPAPGEEVARPQQPGAVAQPEAVSQPTADACASEVFTGLGPERIRVVEEGTRDAVLLDATQPKTGAIGVRFTDTGRAVGALRFQFFRDNELFKVERLVDGACAAVGGFRNSSRGGDPTVLQNWDELEFRLGDRLYVLRLGHSGGEVGINYFRRVAE